QPAGRLGLDPTRRRRPHPSEPHARHPRGSLMLGRVPIAFVAGFLSVLAPCVLPLVPGYLSAVSAVDAGALGERGVALRVVRASIPFFVGFTLVFVALGAGAGALGSAPGLSQRLLLEVAGFVLVVFDHVFVALGPGAGALGSALGRSQRLLLEVAGFIMVVLGLAVLGVVPW